MIPRVFGTNNVNSTPEARQNSKFKNTGLRIISGGMNSTPIIEMESLGGLKSLEEQREEKIALQA